MREKEIEEIRDMDKKRALKLNPWQR